MNKIYLQNTLFCINFALFFFWFCLQEVPKLNARHFFLLNFVRFSKKSQKNDVFFEKKGVFLEKKYNFFALFSCNRCTARDTELKII